MGFETIQLPDFVLADLYKNNLIAATTAEKKPKKVVENNLPTITQQQEKAIKFLGENKKNVVIVVNDNDAVFISDDKLQLLTNLLNACKLTIADVAIINTIHQKVLYQQIKQDLNPKYLILLGKTAKDISLSFLFPEYRVQEYDHCEMLIAADLQNLLGATETVVTEKRKLWQSLKQLFKL